MGEYAKIQINGAAIWLERNGISQFYIKLEYSKDYKGVLKRQLLVTALEENIKKNVGFRKWDYRLG